MRNRHHGERQEEERRVTIREEATVGSAVSIIRATDSRYAPNVLSYKIRRMYAATDFSNSPLPFRSHKILPP